VVSVTTDEVENLIDEGIAYIDVRTIEEFEDGHLPAAFNIPLRLTATPEMQSNPDFLSVFSAHFEKTQKLILGCKAGSRSALAIKLLREAGYEHLLDMSAGYMGSKNAFGQFTPGWHAEGREIEMGGEVQQSYAHLKSRAKL